MKKLRNLTIVSSLFLASFTSSNLQAAKVETAGQAISICKTEAINANPNYKRSKITKIKQTRGAFKIKMKVINETETVKAQCEIDKDGIATYSKI